MKSVMLGHRLDGLKASWWPGSAAVAVVPRVGRERSVGFHVELQADSL